METDEHLGKTPKDWQFRRKFKSNSAFLALIETFSSLRRSEMLRRPSYLAAMSWIMEPKGRDSRKQIVIFKGKHYPVSNNNVSVVFELG